MKKIYSVITHGLMAILLAITPSFSYLSADVSQKESENLEAWAKMYEEMNQASGGEIEKLMKDMEQSGELDALMKELEQSGELDNIIDAMIKSSPEEFLQNLEQELEPERAQTPETYPIAQPAITRPNGLTTPIMEVDKTKLKQIQALLQSIVSKIASIKQKASIRASVQKELSPWEYNLIDLTYYLSTIQDESLAKYLQQPEFASLYDHLVELNKSLSIEEPRLQVEEMLEAEFEDPYITLGFSTSNISRAEVEKRYTELATQKNPFAIKDQLKKQGLAPAEIEAQFRQAQKEYDNIFEAYKRIEQKEVSAKAFLAILQAFHKAIYKDHIIDDVKKLLAKYDPEALKIKEAQEAKEKEAREYRSRVASQRPEFTPPIFEWPSYGGGKNGYEKETKKAKGGDYGWPDFGWGQETARPTKGSPVTEDKGKKEPKKEEKKDNKDKKDKKDDKGKKEPKKDEKDTKEAPKVTAQELTLKSEDAVRKIKVDLDNVTESVNKLNTPTPLDSSYEATLVKTVKSITDKINGVTKTVKDNAKAVEKIKEDPKAGEPALDTKAMVKKYYETIQKTLKTVIGEDQRLKDKLTTVFGYTRQAPQQLATNNRIEHIENLQKAYTNLAYAVTNAGPEAIGEKLKKAKETITNNIADLEDVFSINGASPAAGEALVKLAKELDETARQIDDNRTMLANNPATAPVVSRYNQDVRALLNKEITGNTQRILDDFSGRRRIINTRQPISRTGAPIESNQAINTINTAYDKLKLAQR